MRKSTVRLTSTYSPTHATVQYDGQSAANFLNPYIKNVHNCSTFITNSLSRTYGEVLFFSKWKITVFLIVLRLVSCSRESGTIHDSISVIATGTVIASSGNGEPAIPTDHIRVCSRPRR
jgi:hypothetical protein